MPDTLNENGLVIKDVNEIVSDLTQSFKDIYGNDINVEPNSPDGQLINILAQSGIDIREVLLETYNSFNPDNASGSVLDQRVAINGIERKAGTFTIVSVVVTTDRGVTLAGLDADATNVDGTGYTISDDAGNEFILLDTTTIASAGTTTLNFRAKNIGQVETAVNTITNAVTVVLGVTSLNNPVGALEVGQNEETDAQLRTRRVQSVANASSGYLNGLLGFVLNIDGVTDAKIYENTTSTVNSDGIPAHGTWLIVEGGSSQDIANAYYAKKSYGGNMKGSVNVDIATASGGVFTAKFDRPTSAQLHIKFDIKSTTVSVFDEDAIKDSIVTDLAYKIGEASDETGVSIAAQKAVDALGGGGRVIGTQISSDGVTYVNYLDTSTKQAQWVLDKTRIDITVI